MDCNSRSIKDLEAGSERLVVGAFAIGPGAVCLGVSLEEDKAKSSPNSSSLWESGEIEEEEGGDVENIPTTIVLHSGSMSECKETKNLEGDSLLGLSFLYLPFFILFLDRDPSMEGLFGQREFSEGGGDCGNFEDPLWVYPIDIVESRGIVEERGSEEVLVLLENLALCQEEQEEGTWDESCLLLFNIFLGFSIDGYEDKIFNMMNNICEKRSTVKGKGGLRDNKV